MSKYSDFLNVRVGTEMRACNCIGPQNGAPACPCMMPEHNRRAMADMALDLLRRQIGKPRIRVKAGSSSEPTPKPPVSAS